MDKDGQQFQVSVSSFYGRYGPEKCKGDVLSGSLKCGNCSEDLVEGEGMLNHKEIIFVVDISGSMEDTIPFLKASIKAFTDVLVDGTSSQGNNYDLEDIKKNKHSRLMSKFNLTIITYNEECKMIFPQSFGYPLYFDDIIDIEFKAKGRTNMGDAVEMAYNLKNKERCTWIIIMTDGLPNKGKYQTESSFTLLKKKAPANTRILTLGYGEDFNDNILSELGEFTHINTKEVIPYVFGSVAHEFKYSWGFGGEWKIVSNDVKIPKMKYIVGGSKIGCLYNDREYISGLTPYNSEEIDEYKKRIKDCKIELSFMDINSMKIMKVPFDISEEDCPPPKAFRSRYYSSAKGRRLTRIVNISKRVKTNPSYVRGVCSDVRNDIEDWTEDVALPHKEELLKFIEELDFVMNSPFSEMSNYEEIGYMAGNRAVDCATQTSNTSREEYTFSQSDTIDGMMNAMSNYMSNDVSNNDSIPDLWLEEK